MAKKNSESEIFNLIKKILLRERRVLSSKEIFEIAIKDYSEESSKFGSVDLSKTFAGMLSKEIKVKNPRFVRFNIGGIEYYCVKGENLDKIKDLYEKYLSQSTDIDETNSYIEDDRKKVLELFGTKKQIQNIDLESYTIGKRNENSFCYLLERGTQKLGSIRGGTASKFGVYFSKNEEKYKVSSYFTNENDAIEKIKNEIENIAFSYSLEDVVKSNVLSNMLKYKIFYIYNPSKIIPIFSYDYLELILKNFGSLINDYHEYQKQLLAIYESVKDKKKTTLNFMYFLNSFISRNELVNTDINNFTKIGLKINNLDLYNILISFVTSNFLIFSGPSGVGKSSIVEKIASILNGLDKDGNTIGYKKIAIKSNYSDESSILGYWNPLLGKYESTETLKFLIDAQKYRDNIYFLLLDEMNLSRIENYFSDFLARLDELKDENESKEIVLFETQIDNLTKLSNIKNLVTGYVLTKDFIESNIKNFLDIKIHYKENNGEDLNKIADKVEIDGIEYSLDENNKIINGTFKFKFFIKLSKNLKIIGTINEDETTQSISNKVLDRAQFITFEVGDLFLEDSGDYDFPKKNINFIDYSYMEYKEIINIYKDIFSQKMQNYILNEEEEISEILRKINKLIIKINPNESIAYRVVGDIGNYLKEYIDYDTTHSFKRFQNAFDYQIAQKVITKLKTFNLNNENQKKAFEEIGKIFGFDKSKDLEEMIKYTSYPKTLKFYNYLYSNLLDE